MLTTLALLVNIVGGAHMIDQWENKPHFGNELNILMSSNYNKVDGYEQDLVSLIMLH